MVGIVSEKVWIQSINKSISAINERPGLVSCLELRRPAAGSGRPGMDFKTVQTRYNWFAGRLEACTLGAP